MNNGREVSSEFQVSAIARVAGIIVRDRFLVLWHQLLSCTSVQERIVHICLVYDPFIVYRREFARAAVFGSGKFQNTESGTCNIGIPHSFILLHREGACPFALSPFATLLCNLFELKVQISESCKHYPTRQDKFFNP